MKAEVVVHPGRPPKNNPRFVVSNLPGNPRGLYEVLYCQRGEMENRIKEQQLDLFAIEFFDGECVHLLTP